MENLNKLFFNFSSNVNINRRDQSLRLSQSHYTTIYNEKSKLLY